MKDVCNFPLNQYHRYILPVEYRGLYDVLAEMLENKVDSCKFSGDLDSKKLTDVYNALVSDCPRTYRLVRSELFKITVLDYDTYEFTPNYAGGEIMESIFDNAVSRIVSDVKANCSTALQKELYVHDWFADNVKYTFEGYASEDSEYDVYGAVVERKAVCMGISKAVSYILNLVGVDCGTYSDIIDNHMWNIVRLDGECYHLDVTWDMRDSHGHTVYDYFNLNDMEMERYHHVFKGVPVTGFRYNWYEMNGLVARSYNDLAFILADALSKKETDIVFRNLAIPSDKIAETVFKILKDLRRGKSFSCKNIPETGRVEVLINY